MLDVQSLPRATERELSGDAIEKLLVQGDLKTLQPAERAAYYKYRAESLGLDPLTRPFDLLELQGRTILYTNKTATDQLRVTRGISVTKLERADIRDCFSVTAYGHDAKGRLDSATGIVYIKNLSGENLANAMMRAETKAKRRLTLSLCGAGMLDESEVDSIEGARRIDIETGEVLEPQTVVVEQPFVPIRAQAPEKDVGQEIVTSEDDPVWQTWLKVQGEGQKYGVIIPKVGLPMKRAQLAEVGNGVYRATQARRKKLEAQEAETGGAMVTSREAPEAKQLNDVLTSLGNLGYEQPLLHITSYPTTLALVQANLEAANKVYRSLERQMDRASTAAVSTTEGRF